LPEISISSLNHREILGGMGNGTPLPVVFLYRHQHGQASTLAHATQQPHCIASSRLFCLTPRNLRKQIKKPFFRPELIPQFTGTL